MKKLISAIRNFRKDNGRELMTLIKSLFKKQNYVIPQDKANHFFYGTIATLILWVFGASYWGILYVITGAAFTNEFYDRYKRKEFSWWDIVFTIAFPVILILILKFK